MKRRTWKYEREIGIFIACINFVYNFTHTRTHMKYALLSLVLGKLFAKGVPLINSILNSKIK